MAFIPKVYFEFHVDNIFSPPKEQLLNPSISIFFYRHLEKFFTLFFLLIPHIIEHAIVPKQKRSFVQKLEVFHY